MNCKQGDLAMIVSNFMYPHTVGTIVQCVAFRPHNGEPAWTIDRFVGEDKALYKNKWIVRSNWYFDRNLRPIRPGGGEDETLTWAPRKEGVPA